VATTAIFAEILVVGFQAAAWLTLLVLGLFGTDWVTLSELEKWIALITVLAVATAYMLGVIMDRIADDVFLLGGKLAQAGRGQKLSEQAHGEESGPLSKDHPGTRGSTADSAGADLRDKRFAVMEASEGLGRFLDYQRSRFRVARATAVNAVLTVPAAALFLCAQADPSGGLVVFLASAAIVLILASGYAAIKIGRAWEDSLDAAYDAINRERGTRPSH
jgi:hypothetical protein